MRKTSKQTKKLFETLSRLSKKSTPIEVAILQDLLRSLGYLEFEADQKNSNKTHGMLRVASIPSKRGKGDGGLELAIRQFQLFSDLPITGKLDQPTIHALVIRRCGNADLRMLNIGDRWPNSNLKYKFKNFTTDSQLTPAQIKQAVADAAKLWTDVANLSLSLVSSSQAAEIEISFVTGNHGDDYPFDGVGGVLAHTFYPPPPADPTNGDMHLDDDERWGYFLPLEANQEDLVTVAAHEFGHALGLDHSSNSSALMYRSPPTVRRNLHEDDKRRIQALYGPRN